MKNYLKLIKSFQMEFINANSKLTNFAAFKVLFNLFIILFYIINKLFYIIQTLD
jgi:hypothetical protein